MIADFYMNFSQGIDIMCICRHDKSQLGPFQNDRATADNTYTCRSPKTNQPWDPTHNIYILSCIKKEE